MKSDFIDAETMSNIIKSMNLNSQQLYMNLYKNYNLIYENYNLKEHNAELLNSIDNETIAKLLKLEDRIYTINGSVLSQKERIILEIKNIIRFIQKNQERIPSSIKVIVANELKELETIIKKNPQIDNDIIKYIKKRISILQAYLKMDIKFFYEAFEVFNEQISVSRIKNSQETNYDKLKKI